MHKNEMTSLRLLIATEINRRTGLGEYNQDAGSIKELYQLMYAILGHLIKPAPKKKKKVKK